MKEMKKSLKNTIMIGLAVVLLGTSTITYCYASEGKAAQPRMQQSQQAPDFERNGGQNPIENFGKDSQDSNSNNNNNNDNNNSGNMPQPPQGNGQAPEGVPNQGEAPAQNNDSQQDDSAKQEDGTTEATPNDKGTAAESDDVNVIDTNRGLAPMQSRGHRSDAVAVACYVFLAVQIAIILMILSYLAFSKFNKLTYKQTIAKFKN